MMSLNCGAAFVKYLLCFFNFILFTLGGVLLAVSIWLAIDSASFFVISRISENGNLQDHADTSLVELGAYILIVCGGLIFLVGFLGCCGAAMESRVLLFTYGFLVISVFLLQVTGGILVAIYNRDVEEHMSFALKNSIRRHYASQEEANGITVMWDQIMMKLKCCGVNNHTDFEYASNWPTNETDSEVVIPSACCRRAEGVRTVGEGVQAEGKEGATFALLDQSCVIYPTENNSYHLTGCHDRLNEWMVAQIGCVLSVVLAVGVFEIIVASLAFCLFARLMRKCPEDK